MPATQRPAAAAAFTEAQMPHAARRVPPAGRAPRRGAARPVPGCAMVSWPSCLEVNHGPFGPKRFLIFRTSRGIRGDRRR
jgi:hypothetical protein